MQFWSVNVDPKYLNFAAFSKDLLATLIYAVNVYRSVRLAVFRFPLSVGFQRAVPWKIVPRDGQRLLKLKRYHYRLFRL
jgi:hypothetical protein